MIHFLKNFFAIGYDYFLAAPIDWNCKRRKERSPLTVIYAYRKHLNDWIIHTSANSNELVVRYESLLEDSGATFAKIFEFLCLECTLDSNSLDEKISLYSNETRERGTIEGWKHLFSDYQSIIAAVEDNLKSEISALGYWKYRLQTAVVRLQTGAFAESVINAGAHLLPARDRGHLRRLSHWYHRNGMEAAGVEPIGKAMWFP